MLETQSRIESISKIKKITDALGLVSLMKSKKELEKYSKNKEFIASFDEIKEMLNQSKFNSKKNNRLVILIMSKKGLCGPFNSNLVKFSQNIHDKKSDMIFFIFGEQGIKIAKKNKIKIKKYISDIEKIDELDHIVNIIIDLFFQDYEIYLVYNKFISTMISKPYCEKLLPFDNFNKKILIYEPDQNEVLNFFVNNLIKTKIYFAIKESSICENNARMLCMKSASDSAEEIIGNLKLNYNRVRQNKITEQVRENANN